METTEAAALLDVNETTLHAFDERDPFNGDNRVEGFVCQQSDGRYGALVIFRVNGETTPVQVVLATPKLHYPFARTTSAPPDSGGEEGRSYAFPRRVRKVEVYVKLDGTNVLAYGYADAAGRRFVTFKTRLRPVLTDSRYGPFGRLWSELLQDPALAGLVEEVRSGEHTLSFEMYGFRNQHLVVYDVPLRTSLLFAVRQSDGAILPPHRVAAQSPYSLRPVVVLSSPDDLIGFYNQKRAEAEAGNRKLMDGDDERVEGTEGFVFYLEDEDGLWHQFKCKPESIEALHWASDTIPLSVIQPTAWNALESCDGELTVEHVQDLLLEEFTRSQVVASHRRVEKVVEIIRARLAWRERVGAAYRASGLSFDRDGKGAVLRALSQSFSKADMRRVHAALREMGVAGE